MTTAELVEVGKELAEITREKIAAVMGEFTERLKAIETRVALVKDGAPGPVGLAGSIGERGPIGEQGPTGIKGDTGDAGALGPVGPAGDRGEPGSQGQEGPQGIHGLKGDAGDVGPIGSVGPVGPAGDRGLTGEKGDQGEPGSSVTVEDIRGFLEGEMAKWALDFERRATDQFNRFLERMPPPKDGVDGQDGLGFDDISVDHDGERTFSFVGRRGEITKTLGSGRVPATIDRGVYKDGQSYDKGDGVSWAGSFWIAQEKTLAKPGESGASARAWRLAVKRGSEGKIGPIGPAGMKGDKGDQGEVRQQW